MAWVDSKNELGMLAWVRSADDKSIAAALNHKRGQVKMLKRKNKKLTECIKAVVAQNVELRARVAELEGSPSGVAGAD